MSISQSTYYPIGELMLLNATFLRKGVQLVNNETGKLEEVIEGKDYNKSKWSRYYAITDEPVYEDDIVLAFENNINDKYEITFLNQVKNRERKTCLRCYPIANTIIPRVHSVYYHNLSKNLKEYFRFLKVMDRYAGFPAANKYRITRDDANKRWDFIFNYLLNIPSNQNTKRKIGSLFGGIQFVDLKKEEVINTINKYKLYLKNKI